MSSLLYPVMALFVVKEENVSPHVHILNFETLPKTSPAAALLQMGALIWGAVCIFLILEARKSL